MTRWPQLALAGLMLSGLVPAQDGAVPTEPALDDAGFATWRDRIRITDAELAWEQLPWYVTYNEGLQRAGVEGKPLLLWVMNGHPLGCT